MNSELESELAAAEDYAPQRASVMAAVAAGSHRRLVRRRIASIGAITAGVVAIAVVTTVAIRPAQSPAGPAAPAAPTVDASGVPVENSVELTGGSSVEPTNVGQPAPVTGSGEGYPPGWTSELDELIGPFAIKVMDVADGYPGFADVRVDYPTRSVQVFFNGDLPAAVTALTSELAASGVGLVHIQTYSAEELEKAAETLSKAVMESGIKLTRMGPAAGYMAVELAGPKLSTDPALQAQVKEMAPELIGDIPVTFGPVLRSY